MNVYKKFAVSVNVRNIENFIEKVVRFGALHDLKQFGRMETFQQNGVKMTFYGWFLRRILSECKSNSDGITIDNFDMEYNKFEVGKTVGRTSDGRKARCFAEIRAVDIDELSGEVTFKVTVMEPIKVLSTNEHADLEPGEFYTELVDSTQEFCVWIQDNADFLEDIGSDPDYAREDHLKILEIFYSVLNKYKLVKIPTEVAVSMYRLYPNVCRRIPSFKEASLSSKAEVMYDAARHCQNGDVHYNAKKIFYALLDAGMIDRFVYRPDYFGSYNFYTLHNVEENRQDRYPVGLRGEGEIRNGWYLIKNDLIWIRFRFMIRGVYPMYVTLKPFDIWHSFTEGCVLKEEERETV